jgi:hypothetical protein
LNVNLGLGARLIFDFEDCMGESNTEEGTKLQREAIIEVKSRKNGFHSVAEEKDNPSKQQHNNQDPARDQRRKGGGPRTAQGKKASSRNSRTHGIFATLLLREESAAEFNGLLQGFRDYFRPEGTPEDVLVEELATLKWRQRRLLNAEKAEIQFARTFNPRTAERKREDRTELVMSELSATTESFGMLEKARNPEILARVIELLEALEFSIGMRKAFDPEEDRPIIAKLYGKDCWCELRLEYEVCSDPTPWSGTPLFKEYDLPIEKRIVKFVQCLRAERSRLTREIDRLTKLSDQKDKMEIESSWVPEAPRLERLLRYAASIERSFERGLNQLERLQRYRLGQPVFPPINVQLST